MGKFDILVFKIWCLFSVLTSVKCQTEEFLSKVRCCTEASLQQEAAKALIGRVVGDRSDDFNVIVNPELSKDGKDVFKIFKSNSSKTVDVEGSSGVAVAWGFHHYLKYFCNCHISWNDDQLNLPLVLPQVDIRITANDRFRYYQNVCTTSYSFVWWDWLQWERHIDWMALNGINLALAFNGQEAIWQRVYSRLNMTSSEIDQHFTGPAFFAWGRMGNIRGWAGPLSEGWHSNSVTLQKLILARMRALGIIPVLPAFAGHVPHALKRLYPNVNFTLATRWNQFEDKYCCEQAELMGTTVIQINIVLFGDLLQHPPVMGDSPFVQLHPKDCERFIRIVSNVNLWKELLSFDKLTPSPYLLSPEDPLFKTVGSMFLKEMIKEFGTNHIYNCDTFNEMPPAEGDSTFLKKVGESIFQSMTQVDPDAIWMMQGWIFFNERTFWTKERAEALLKSVPIGRMLVLDLMSELNPQFERLDSYFGQPYIWCMLHNFGGTLGMHGTAKRVNENVFKARTAPNSSMVGTGLTMEGIYQNYIIYDLMSEMGWRGEPTDLSQWFRNYSSRRYGQNNQHLDNTWQLLKGSVYDYTSDDPNFAQYILISHPSINLTSIPDSVYDYKSNWQNHGRYIVVRNPSLRLKPNVWYNTSDVMEAWDEALLAVESDPSLAELATFKHDLTDLTRQALQLKVDFIYGHVLKAYNLKDITYLRNATGTFLAIMEDLNSLLASNKWFLLGPWLESAKARASSIQERKQFEEMARNQITLWGPNGEIRDYACKQWADLMENYYIPRWEYFFKALEKAVADKTPFNQRSVSTLIFTEIEKPFTFGQELYPTFEIGETVEISRKLHEAWRRLENHYQSFKRV